MIKAIYRIKIDNEEWVEEIGLHICNYTLFCCKEEITLKLNEGVFLTKCKKCNKTFKSKFEGFITTINT